jgi:hypothetical protein
MRFRLLFLLHKSYPSGSLTHILKYFGIQFRICRDIRIQSLTSCCEYNGKLSCPLHIAAVSQNLLPNSGKLNGATIWYSGKLNLPAEYVAASQILLWKYLNISAVSLIASLYNMALSQNLLLYMWQPVKTRCEHVAVHQILHLHIIRSSGRSNLKTLKSSLVP